MKNDDGHLIELIAFLNQKSEPLFPDENKFDHLIQCLAHLKKANLLDGLLAGYRSFLDPLTKTYEEISFEDDNIPMSFLFGPNTYKFIELYELMTKLITNRQGDNDKKRFIAILKEVTEELSRLLLSQRLLKKYYKSILFRKSGWFRNYVFNLKDRPIFILRRPAFEDELLPSTTRHGRILPVYNTWKPTYLNKLKCFMDASTDAVVNQLIDSDLSIFSTASSPGRFYKKVLNHIWDCQPLLHDFPFEFKEDDLFEKEALEKQIKACEKLLTEDGVDNTFFPDDLAKFLASTALVGEWQINYYISTNLFEKEHQGTSYSLFFSSVDLQMTKRKFIELWRMASNLESANYISELLQKQERVDGISDGISDTLSAFSHEVRDASSLLFDRIIFPANSLETSTALPDKSQWLVCPVPSLFEACRNNVFIHAGGRGCVAKLFQKKQGDEIALKDGLNILINKAKEIAAIRNLGKPLWVADFIADRYSEFEIEKNKFQLQPEGEDKFILIINENTLHLQIFVRCFLAAGANCLQHNPDGVKRVQIDHDKDRMQVVFYNDGDKYKYKPYGTEDTLRALLMRLGPEFAEKVFMGNENSKIVTRFSLPCNQWIKRRESSYGTEMGSC
jgi:hypothetical protein